MKTKIQNQRSAYVMVLLCVFITLAFIGCKKEETADKKPGANEVWMQNIGFTPSTITVPVNTTITWTNKDTMQHNVTSDTAGLFTSPDLNPSQTYARQFTTAGTFPYQCTIHPGMAGTVIVTP